MLLDRNPYTLDRVVRLGVTTGLLWGLIWLLNYLSDVLFPFAAALLLAYLLNPLVTWVQQRVTNRVLAVWIALGTVVTVVGLTVWLILPIIVHEIDHMSQVVSKLIDDADLGQRAARRLPPDLWEALRDLMARQEVRDLFQTETFWNMVTALGRKVVPGVWGFLAGTASMVMGLVGLLVIGLYLVFLLLDYDKVQQWWQTLLPPAYRDVLNAFAHDCNDAMSRYFRAQAAVAALVGMLFAIGFLLIGLPLGLLLGLGIGLLNMVPYLQVLGLVPTVILALVHALETGGSFLGILGLTGLVFVVVQLIQDTILVPRIMGRITGLSPAIILLSLSIWGKLLGIFGLLIALPMTCVLLAYYQRFIASAWLIQAEASPPEA